MQPFAIYSLSVNNVLWTPYVVQNSCNEIIFLNSGTDIISLRTNASDPTTQLQMSPGQEFEIDGHLPGAPDRRAQEGRNPYRFMAGATACYFQSTTSSNTGPITAVEML
jgi:hypothetical protein